MKLSTGPKIDCVRRVFEVGWLSERFHMSYDCTLHSDLANASDRCNVDVSVPMACPHLFAAPDGNFDHRIDSYIITKLWSIVTLASIQSG